MFRGPASAVAVSLAALLFATHARAEDSRPPVIKHTAVAKANKGESVTLTARIEDESEILEANLNYRTAGSRKYSAIAMTRRSGNFVATIQVAADMEYYIEAYDEFANGPAREGSADRPLRITAVEKAPKVAARETPRVAPKPAPKPEPKPEPEPEPEKEPEAAPAPAPAVVQPLPLPPGVGAEEEPPPAGPIYTRWWFIGGAAVVTVAAVVGVAVLARPDPVRRDVFTVEVTHP